MSARSGQSQQSAGTTHALRVAHAAIKADDLTISEKGAERTDRGRAGEPSGLGFIERCACRVIRAGPTPRHVAFIMDGNRRFARERGWDVAQGHRQGYDKLEEALRWCCELGVHGVTVYAFSIENFKRSAEEVQALMALTEEKLRAMSDEQNLVQRRGVRVRIVGDLSRVSDSLREEMRRVMRETKGNTRHTLTVCFSYTSRNEIAAAVRRLATACDERRLIPHDVDEELVERCLPTSMPGHTHPVDLIVRTSGERRLSDFLLWQSATCAVAFTAVLWPELSLLRFLSLLLRFQRTTPYMRAVKKASSGEGGGAVAGAKAGEHAGSGVGSGVCCGTRCRRWWRRLRRSGARSYVRAAALLLPFLALVAFTCLVAAAVACGYSRLVLAQSGIALSAQSPHALDGLGDALGASAHVPLLLRLAGGCVCGWLMLAITCALGPEDWRLVAQAGAGRACPAASPAAKDISKMSACLVGSSAPSSAATVDATPSSLSVAAAAEARCRRTQFLAVLNVDRRL